MTDEVTYAAKTGIKSIFEMMPIAAMMRFVELYNGSRELRLTSFALNSVCFYWLFYRGDMKGFKSYAAVAVGGALSYTATSLLIDWLYH